jgi:hypothetical protein
VRIFAFSDIKQAGDCNRYMKDVLFLQPTGKAGGWTCYNNPWRPGSDSGAFHVAAQGFKDHVSDESGSIIDLCMKTKNLDLFEAQEFLGQWLGLKEKMTAKQGKRVVATYDYLDMDGKLVHQTVRFEPKSFAQRRPDPAKPGEWLWTLDGIEPVLYRLREWKDQTYVLSIEGEKDCDNLVALGFPATTNPMGAANWRPSYNPYFKDKIVVIIPDNDDAGREHAQIVTAQVKGHAKEVRVVELPNLPPKGDVTDWIEAGGTKDQLTEMIRAAKPVDLAKIGAAPDIVPKEESVAKQANKEPLRNFRWRNVEDNGGTRQTKEPIPLHELIAETHRRFWGFPKRVGDRLFDHDRDTGDIVYISNTNELFAWMNLKSKGNIYWPRLEGAPSKDEVFSGVYQEAEAFNMIMMVPTWPERSDVFKAYGTVPDPTPDARYFNKLCDFFSPATDADRLMIRAMFASPLYYERGNERPMWIIDAVTGPGTGKSKLAQLLADLYGSHDSQDPLWVDYKAINKEDAFTSIIKRIMSPSGRRKRIFVLDNVEGYYKSSQLASFVTQTAITGMSPYGRGEETRPNDLTYVITMNSATLSGELGTRGFFINLKAPEHSSLNWEHDVQAFITAHRMQIISDIIGILQAGPQFDFTPQSRFKVWERKILVPMCGTMENYSIVSKATIDRKVASDGDRDDAEALRAHCEQKLGDFGLNHETTPVWITAPVMVAWARECIPDWSGKFIQEKAIGHFIRNFVKRGLIPQMSTTPDRYKFRDFRDRGYPWNFKLFAGDTPLHILHTHTTDHAIAHDRVELGEEELL